MKVIKKLITYNDFISRIPGIIPSIKDSWTIPSLYNKCNEKKSNEIFFDYAEAIKRIDEYNIKSSVLEYNGVFVDFTKELKYNETGNYGLVPSDIIIPKLTDDDGNDVVITDYTDLYINLPITDEFIETVSEEERNKYDTYFDLSYPVHSEDPHYEFNEETNRFGIYSGDDENKVEIQVITYNTLNKWYSFAKERERVLTSGANKKKYNSYIEYNENENLNQYEYYKELEDLYISRGGDYLYNWIKDNCIVVFNIPSEFADEWKTDFLYYPQAIKWLKWFEIRDKLYYDEEVLEELNDKLENFDGTEEEREKLVRKINECSTGNTCIKDCKLTENCCDCNEYVRLGGHEFYLILKNWIDENTEFNITNTNSACFSLFINLQNSIDDFGEMSILSSRWENDVDYHNTLTGDTLDPSLSDGGTVVYLPYKTDENTGKITMIYDTAMIKDGNIHKGYQHNRFYENTFKESDWINTYTDYYIKHNVEEYASSAVSAYAYSTVYNNIIYNPDTNIEMFRRYINPTLTKFFIINGEHYGVINGKYVEMCYTNTSIANLKFKNHTKLRIYKDGDLEYAILDGTRFYVETVEENGEKVEKIFFLKNYSCEDSGCYVNSNAEYIMFNDILYIVENNSVTIDTGLSKNTYYSLDGFFNLKNNIYYLKKYGNSYSIVLPYKYEYTYDSQDITYNFRNLDESDIPDDINTMECISSSNGVKIRIEYKYDIYYCDKITGYTDSKLELLRRREVTTDDLGNELPGYFKSIIDDKQVEKDYGNSPTSSEGEMGYYADSATTENDKAQYYNNPYEGCVLDILYKVGEVSNLKRDEYLSTGATQYFVGNIIENIEFYYSDITFNPVEDFPPFSARNDDALEQIELCENARMDYTGDTILYDSMICRFTYYLGAILKQSSDGKHYERVTDFHTGIKYVDTAFVNLSNYRYKTVEGTEFFVKFYDFTSIRENSYSQDNLINSSLMITKFEVEPMLFYYNSNKKLVLPNKSKFDRWEGDYDFIASPVFRSEYNIGNAIPQSIEGNIYIDRGINSAFERHLKLQEVKTMEALENFGNNWFKIIKD